VGRSGERREEKNEPARRRPWGNRPDPPRARLEDGNTVTGAGSTRTSATEPCIAGHHPLPSHAATVKIYRCAPPHRQAAGDACDPLVKKRALECQDMEMSEESGATSKYNDDGQIDDSLQSIQKIRDEILRKESILQERSAQCDMDIQTLLSGILPISHFKHAYIYNHAVELLQFCGQHCRQVFLGAICFQKFCTKLWCITLFNVDKSSTALCDVQIVRQNCGQFWQDVFLEKKLMFWQEVASILVPHFLYSSCFKTYAEGKMTPKAVSIIRKYKETCSDMTEATNSSCSRDGGQSITKRKKLKEALLRQCKVRNLKLNLCITILNATSTLDTCQCRSLMRSVVGPIGYSQDTQYYLQCQTECTMPVYV
uniref:Uncharacterized protein n=1 Tax=Aegilops tauschii subsp. strangulata TaxID=200361 RepID=A0A453QZ50_AEGTS